MKQIGWKWSTKPKAWTASDLRVNKAVCRDCGAPMERFELADRCPWSNLRRGVTVMGPGRATRYCRWPYGHRPQTDVMPARPSRN